MSTILGINAFHADAAAVLLRDGAVVGAIAEERINRVKHYAGFPAGAVRRLLEVGELTIHEVEHIAIGRDATANLKAKLGFALKNLGAIGRLARQRLENRGKVRDIPALVAEACGVAPGDLRARVHHVEHHLCHAASAFLPSAFERAAILTVDGFGDFASTALGVGEGSSVRLLDRVLFPHSLGVYYTAVCQLIGFDRYGDEGKVMGLAPYGAPRFADLMRDLVRVTEGGKFELGLDYFVHHTEGVDYGHDAQGRPTVAPLYSEKLLARAGPVRRRGEDITQRDRDLAASLQARLEEVYFHLLRGLHRRTGLDAVCLAGGVALNSVANGKVLSETPFRRLAVHPAAADDGTALGAAYHVHTAALGRPRPAPLLHACLGDGFSDVELAAAIESAGLEARSLSDEALFPHVAKALAQGDVVGWFQGRMEWGPRALGGRSILAHPGLAGIKERLNARIKQREPFRPFAPSVLAERAGDYFTETWPSPFMTQVYPTREGRRGDLQATDHVDHTGRLQTVDAAHSPRFHRLIKAFEQETGIPALLNTSFNENEPIVRTPAEAIACFLRTRMDCLVLGAFVLRRDAPKAEAP